jgi:hypothetical protein
MDEMRAFAILGPTLGLMVVFAACSSPSSDVGSGAGSEAEECPAGRVRACNRNADDPGAQCKCVVRCGGSSDGPCAPHECCGGPRADAPGFTFCVSTSSPGSICAGDGGVTTDAAEDASTDG